MDAATLSVVRNSGDSLRWRGGPENGTKIAVSYAPGGTSGPGHIRVLDMTSGELTGSYIPHLQTGEPVAAYQVMLLPDDQRVIVAGPSSDGCYVLVGDLKGGQTLLQFRRFGCSGEIVISPDTSFAVVSDPSSLANPETPPPGIDVIDLRNLRHLKRFGPADFPVDQWDWFFQICFTADSKKVIVASRPKTTGWLYVINLAELRVEDITWPDTGFARIGALGYGPQPH